MRVTLIISKSRDIYVILYIHELDVHQKRRDDSTLLSSRHKYTLSLKCLEREKIQTRYDTVLQGHYWLFTPRAPTCLLVRRIKHPPF